MDPASCPRWAWWSAVADLPPPPVPADCDLRGMPGFMLDTERLMASELWALSDGATFKAAMALWCRSWRQVPAASLPDEDATLRAFAGLSPAAWKKCRDLALRGFVKCSDGRIYHKVLAEDATRAWGHRQQQRAKAARRWSGNAAASTTTGAEAMPRHDPGTPAADPMQSQGQGQGQSYINPTTTTTAARERVTGFDAHAVRYALNRKDALGIIAAFGGTMADREGEWRAEANGMQLGELAVVLWLAMREGDPIRQPSGLRKARASWDALPIEERRGIAAIAVPDLGIRGAA